MIQIYQSDDPMEKAVQFVTDNNLSKEYVDVIYGCIQQNLETEREGGDYQVELEHHPGATGGLDAAGNLEKVLSSQYV